MREAPSSKHRLVRTLIVMMLVAYLGLLSLLLLTHAPFQATVQAGPSPGELEGDISRAWPQEMLGGGQGLMLLLGTLLMLVWSYRRHHWAKKLDRELKALDADLRKLAGHAPVQGFIEAYLDPGRRSLERGGAGRYRQAFHLVHKGRRQCHLQLGEHLELQELLEQAQRAMAACRSEGLNPGPEPLQQALKAQRSGLSLHLLKEQARAVLADYQGYLDQGRQARVTLDRLHRELREAAPFVAVDQARNGLDQAQVALNRGEASRALNLAQAAVNQLRHDIQTAHPELLAQMERELPLGVWHTLKFTLSNHGRAHAQGVRLRLEGVRYRPIGTITYLKAGQTITLEVALKVDRQGTLPLNLIITGSRTYDNGLISFEQAEWLEVGRPLGPSHESHPGWRPSRDGVRLMDPTRVSLVRETEFYRGYVRVKVAAHNRTDRVVTDTAVELLFDELAFRLDRVEPEFTVVGTKALLGNLNPGQKRTLAYYLDPLICTTSQLDGTLAFKDIEGRLQLTKMRSKQVEVKCPLFFTPEVANTATLTKLVTRELEHSDARIFGLPPGLVPAEAFTLAKEVLGGRDIRHVQSLDRQEPYTGEAWYYGLTKVLRHKFAIRVVVDETTRSLELFCAAPAQEALTGLLAELGSDLKQRLERTGWPIQRITNITIRDSILNRTALLFQPPEDLSDSGTQVPAKPVKPAIQEIRISDSLINRSGPDHMPLVGPVSDPFPAAASAPPSIAVEPGLAASAASVAAPASAPAAAADMVVGEVPGREAEPLHRCDEPAPAAERKARRGRRMLRGRSPSPLEVELARLREIEQQLP